MTIPIDKETILFFVIIIAWSNNHIASFNKFDNVSHAMTALKLVKKCAACSEFLFCLFSRFRHSCGCPEFTSRVSGIIMKTFSWSPSKLRFPFKNQPSDGKHQIYICRLTHSLDLPLTDLHQFQTRFVIGWENNRDGDITMPLSLKTIGSAGCRDYYSN